MIMKSLFLATVLAANCPPTKLIGFDAPLTEQETESLNHAKKRCQEIYPESPCLKSFEKREEQVFWAICGQANKTNNGLLLKKKPKTGLPK